MRSAITTAITDVMDTGSGERGSPIRSRAQNFVTTGAMLDTGWYSLEMCMLQIWHTVLNDAWFSKTKQPASSRNVRELALSMCVWGHAAEESHRGYHHQPKSPYPLFGGWSLKNRGHHQHYSCLLSTRWFPFFCVVRFWELEELSEIG